MPSYARRARRTVDIWPGWVDALSTLLIIIIFVLLVFVLGQFFLQQEHYLQADGGLRGQESGAQPVCIFLRETSENQQQIDVRCRAELPFGPAAVEDHGNQIGAIDFFGRANKLGKQSGYICGYAFEYRNLGLSHLRQNATFSSGRMPARIAFGGI